LASSTEMSAVIVNGRGDGREEGRDKREGDEVVVVKEMRFNEHVGNVNIPISYGEIKFKGSVGD
jgi:hypothetical protein